MRLIKALFALLMILALSPLLAQEEPESTSGGSDPEAAASSADAAPPPAPAPGALDEYEASEQISEDLSVAFPVDI